ncbi:MAG: RsmB/NOP family class I SAM-dependent RNA methyltransferase [Tabrizicola sp.]|uniref:RsmB/NOP family class I SAM-dependent RNA methyltransferase n=1 Tax=Tabrizicola sp. TaxID=2005166 RepID=UPI002736392A|nr:RsmB/NOP family class I SAM-dependent RNA methyltransferase [Tabrizicola sp.]MDP3263301.1 RsmB/NOP family class I SAM-dependent RNA methyltransferase [Tabrizicola sp.]MDP3646658.1 RsmB/NOP family class I SAM-dependent RNA methyltransferase [Paracoccaceae bacterium]MDZ4068188.1 RsmB/NOP family class I SAM-dependent RNA methyltransferase [Tabrizicola sp.]
MTPGARAAAAIAVLDRHLAGEPVERALTNWGRASRFAGSGDRAAVRDLVFDALRCKRSHAALGGAMTGRGLILGGVRASGGEEGALFTGEGHAPARVAPDETGRAPAGAAALDVPDWLLPALETSLGDATLPVLHALQSRAPVFLRVNLRKTSVAQALARLAGEEIAAKPHPLAKTALEVTGNARKVQTSESFLTGLVELQDASSQAVVEALPLRDGMRVLDQCAGGGGKTLAMAGQARIKVWAHDANPRRMADLPERARRAGVAVSLTEAPETLAPFDLVLVDAPCSGSGSWRRDPEGKWALTEARLAEVVAVQAEILARAARMVGPGGTLAYATCSLLAQENEGQVNAFLAAHPGWTLGLMQRFLLTSGGDGFFVALLTRA